MPPQPSKELETFPNPRLGREYEISFETPEFTCLCPRTGQPDFATIRIRYVPRELTDRPKMGFGMPMGRWLRRELRPWAENLLSPDRIRGTGDVAVDPVRRAWQEHLDGVDRLPQIWTALMFLQWSERWRASAVPA